MSPPNRENSLEVIHQIHGQHPLQNGRERRVEKARPAFHRG